jgi:hypothetical protein
MVKPMSELKIHNNRTSPLRVVAKNDGEEILVSKGEAESVVALGEGYKCLSFSLSTTDESVDWTMVPESVLVGVMTGSVRGDRLGWLAAAIVPVGPALVCAPRVSGLQAESRGHRSRGRER